MKPSIKYSEDNKIRKPILLRHLFALAAGLNPFRQRYPQARALLVGGPGIPLAEFFGRLPQAWLT